MIEVRSHNGSAGVYAARAIRAGERVLRIDGPVMEEPDRYSIQIGRNVHVHATDSAWKYLNHSCSANLVYVAEPRGFTAIRDISAGEELSFNYLTTEWSMSEVFDCRCGSDNCHRRIEGFRHLDHDVQIALFEEAAPHIQSLFAEMEPSISEESSTSVRNEL